MNNLSPSQIERRLNGITATDMAAILGVHPYRSAIDVWRAKVQPQPGETGALENERTKWGVILEPIIRADYAERHGVTIQVPGTLQHEEHAWMLATPDGLVYRDRAEPERGHEIKCHTIRLRHLYGAPGTDEVPPYELVQCGWSMGVTGLQRWDLTAFIDGLPTDYVIDRDDELIGAMRERGERFLRDYVHTKIPPPADGSDGFDTYLDDQHKAHNAEAGLISIDGNPEMLEVMTQLRVVRALLDAREADEKLLEQKLKAVIGDNAGVDWTNGKRRDKITWKRPKDSIDTDHAAIAGEMLTTAQLVASTVIPQIPDLVKGLRSIGGVRHPWAPGSINALEALANAITAITDPALYVRHTHAVPNARRLLVPAHWKLSDKTSTTKEP